MASSIVRAALDRRSFEQLASYDHLAYFCRAGTDFQKFNRPIQSIDLRLPDITITTKYLYGVIQNVIEHVAA